MITEPKTYRTRGVVVVSNTQVGVKGLKVEAWDKDLFFDDALGTAETNAQGAFEITFDTNQFQDFFERNSDLYFKIFLGDDCIKNTENSVLWNRKLGDTPVRISVDMPVSLNDGPKDYLVKGTVRLADDSPLKEIKVVAFDRDLRSEQLLGQNQTDKQGFYQIGYSPRQLRKAEKGSANLVVKVYADDDFLLAASLVSFNAPPVAEINLTIPAEILQPPSLFEKTGKELEPLLEGLKVEELEEDKEHQDLIFLSGETGFDKVALARFVLAHKLAQRDIQPEFWFVLLSDSFYQFTENQSLKDQLTTVLDALPSLDAAAVRKALIRGFNQKEISETFREKLEDWIETFLKFIANLSVQDGDKPTFVKLALEDARITDASKQKKFARMFNEHKALTPELLDTLEKDTAFSKAEVADLRTSFEIADLTRSDFSVVKMIKNEFDIRTPEKIRFLAKKSEDEWVTLVHSQHAAGNIKLSLEMNSTAGGVKLPDTEIYGKMLERCFREAFPTTAFSGGLERALQSDSVHGFRQPKILNQFLNLHDNFELLTTPVDEFLKNGIHSDFRTQAKDENFRLELNAVQRVFKLAPTFEVTDALLADGLHSAQKIYRLGQSEFIRRFEKKPGFTTETARLAWNRAADTHAAVLTMIVDLKALESETLPQVLKNNDESLSKFPNWNNLFKTGDLCDCEHCRSMLSPAAYFADLLMFLKDRKTKNPANTVEDIPVKDILFKRRSDLGFLELNCANALTTLPYIDVVCEVLEDAVDANAENDLKLSGFFAIPPDVATAKTAVASAFKNAFIDQVNTDKEKIELSADFSLSKVSSSDPDRWVVHGDNVTYLLKKKLPATDFFAEILRNTKASAVELRAYPQYVNPKAYEKLRTAKYPLNLPFDLFAEEVRAAFQKTNLQRWDLMRTLRGTTAPYNPCDGEIAAEYFGINIDAAAKFDFDEKRLILLADDTIAGQQIVWGEAGTNWLNDVGNVKNFLQKTKLEYNELLALIDLKFLNPASDITVPPLDSSCDTDQKIIQLLDERKLDRIHRFLRLWRKLKGWKMWELDLVIRHPRIGNGLLDESFLVNLFYFSQLRNKLGAKATVEELCALFGDMNTETRFTKLHEKRDDALYQNLFLNRRLMNPLDLAFQLNHGINDLTVGETLTEHHLAIQAALGIREADLILLEELTKASDGTRHITNDLTLANLSFLWRHAWLSKQLKFKAEEWKTILNIFQQDILQFTDPKAAWKFVEGIDRLKTAGFTPDELNWLLCADRSAKAAVKETDAARFLAALRKDLQAIQMEFDPGQYDFLTVSPPTDIDSITTLLTSLLLKLNCDEATAQLFIASLRDEVTQEAVVMGLPAGFDFPVTIKNAIRIRYDEPATTLRFTGLMTDAERKVLLNDPSLATVTDIVAYQKAIEKFFTRPRCELKFFEPIFTAPLANLPPAVDFKSLADPALALKISYDAEQRLLRFVGILSSDEKAALNALSGDTDYRNAVNSLFTQPNSGVFPPEKIGLLDTDLQFPLRDLKAPANDHLAENLTAAVTKALAYLSKTQMENTVVQQSSAQLGVSEAITRRLLTQYPLLPDTLMAHLTDAFVSTSGIVDYATLKTTFDGWYWLNRAASILKKWKITLTELEKITALTAKAQLLNLVELPLNDTGAKAPIDRFIRTSRLLCLRETLPETKISLLEVLEKLDAGTYATTADFAADVQLLDDTWFAGSVEALITSLDLAYPTDYLLAESWERLRRAFYFLDNLNASANTAKAFATAIMAHTHAAMIKELLRSKLGTETWLTLSTEIQDVLRERKRDALAAYLLTRPPKLDDVPSGKWENTNDLYAYYLLDVEMSSCQLISRLVQGSGSIQLFVQRCFMGLEPDVAVKADGEEGDSAWRWWKWMRKYRVWEANRKVFLWPENWIEPELKKDRSPFFKDMENELLQNEINQYTVETALANYLEKLDGVAQLEIAGFYQEDDGDNAIIHVFGRTAGVEPHLYYYRRYDYRQWTPWEKVDLDIQGNYLIPFVVNKRLLLFWPIFTEIPDESENSGNYDSSIPSPGATSAKVKKALKLLKLQMAVSDYRQGKWTPKKISKDFAQSYGSYNFEILMNQYQFIPIDWNNVNKRFTIQFNGISRGKDGTRTASLDGEFEIFSCMSVPVLKLKSKSSDFRLTMYSNEHLSFGKWVELGATNEFGGESAPHSRGNDDFHLDSEMETLKILDVTPGFFKMTPSWHPSYLDHSIIAQSVTKTERFGHWAPFFYNDEKRTFFVLPSAIGSTRLYYPDIKKAFLVREKQLFHFKNYYHPFVCDFAKLVYNPLKGIPALMSRETQLKNSGFSFKQTYKPTSRVVELPPQYPNLPDSYPQEDVDFTADGAYSSYNWELFFHAPLLIANSLSKNQRFEEARDWYHFIFNPIGVESPMPGGTVMSKYWITKPFFETTKPQYLQQRIDNILRMLAGDASVPSYSAQSIKDIKVQVFEWRTNPFEPHRIANYRTVAYQKTVVMKYLDNLIAWGDYLFRQDNMESNNEATQLYIMAAEILGPRPKKIPPQAKPLLESFNELEAEFDKFSNALVKAENLVPLLSGIEMDGSDPAPLPMLYFCIPQNDKMLGYWDTVADRLYKIRHCMSIEGVVRQLALFEPPIDPGALVKAVAGGVDISSVLADLNAPLPLYRFNVLLQKANEICNDVKALGGMLLAALEKKDAEALSLLRQGQEIRLLDAVKAVRQKQIEEAKENLEGVKKSKELAQIRKQYYESREFMNIGETVAISLNTASTLLDIPVSIGYITGGALKAIPNFQIGASGFGGSPHATAQTGGNALGDAAKFAAEGLGHIARNLDKMAALSSTLASYTRRQNEWDFQKDLAVKEIEQLDKTIAAAELRISIAEKELENHVIQIENAKTTDEYMHSKYTNEELYQWQIGQISGVYFQSYKLAYDLAKRAERCFRFELGLQDSSYIQFGYWDSLKKGLLSGEKLQYDLRRLETAYLEQNRRELELTKHISLLMLDPLALVKLKETGRCFINLPEEIYDLDYPGHYFRRIKSVSITLPCIVGPYTTISCTLRLLKNSIRINTTSGNKGYPRNTDDRGLPADDPRFIENNIPVKSIATSNAQNDSGVFELSFRDERYLPFEGAGVISEWSLELFSDFPSPDFGKLLRQFDYSTISDAIVHVKYTAREDAGSFKNGAIVHLREYFSKDGTTHSVRLFNLRQEFPTQWHRFLNPTNPANGNIFELEMAPSLFRILDEGKALKINTIWLLARCIDVGNYDVIMTPPLPEPPPAGSNTFTLSPDSQYGGLHFSQKDVSDLGIKVVPTDPPVKWRLKMTSSVGNLQDNEVKDVLVIIGYEKE